MNDIPSNVRSCLKYFIYPEKFIFQITAENFIEKSFLNMAM